MPAKSESQRRLMYAALKNKKLREQKDIPLSVAKEYTQADTGGKLPEKVKQPEQSQD